MLRKRRFTDGYGICEALVGAGVVAVGWAVVAAIAFEYGFRSLFGR